MPGENKPDAKGLRFLEINDFSPGIYNNTLEDGVPGGAPGVPGIFPAPPGAADATHTYSCMALPSGGLGPGPALGGSPGSSGLSLSGMGITLSNTGDILCLINSYQTQNDELVIGVNDWTNSAQVTSFYSYVVSGGTLNKIYGPQTNTHTVGGTGTKNYCAYPYLTLFSYLTTDQPAVILPFSTPGGGGTTGPLMTYPDYTAPSAFGTNVLANHFGIGFGHQGRVVLIEVNTTYQWPTTITEFPPELYGFTDPALTPSYSVRGELFGPENPFGYGAVSSVSAGEFFAIKRRGGAIIIQGDLSNPTVTSLPGVQSTGYHTGRSDVDQNGMYYCAQSQGAWVWNGGSSSQKISAQLFDNFYKVLNPITETTFFGYYCQRWNDWMLFSNNYVYNTSTNSWWKLMDNTTNSFFWYVPGYLSRYMFAALPTVSSGSTPFLFEFDRSTPAASYQWQSLPLRFPTEDHFGEAREVVIRASNPYADATPSIVTSLVDNSGNVTTLDTWNMTTGTNTVQETRLQCRIGQTTTIAVRIAASGTLYAPTLFSLGIGYRQREHIAIT